MVYKRITLHFPSILKLTLKINHIFSYVLISEVTPKFSYKFHEIIIKIFQKFVVNVSKTFLTFLSKKFFNLSEIFWIVMLYGTSIYTDINTSDTFRKGIDTKFFRYFNTTILYSRWWTSDTTRKISLTFCQKTTPLRDWWWKAKCEKTASWTKWIRWIMSYILFAFHIFFTFSHLFMVVCA